MKSLLLILVLLAGQAHALPFYSAQFGGGTFGGGAWGPSVPAIPPTACTLGPFTAVTSFATLAGQITGATDNAVVCLQRGESWSAGTAQATFTVAHPSGARVTVCASTGVICTDSGAADPVLAYTGAGSFLQFNGTSGGYELRHIHLASNGVNGSIAVKGGNANGSDPTATDVRFVGGGAFGFGRWCSSGATGGQTTAPTGFEFGTLADVWEITDDGHSVTRSGAVENTGCDGIWQSTAIRVYMHDISQSGGAAHLWDMGHTGTFPTMTDAVHDVIVEGGHFAMTTISTGSGFKFDWVDESQSATGVGVIVRDNVIDAPTPTWLAISSHGPDGNCYGAIGVEVYRNLINATTGQTSFVLNSLGRHIRVYNNLMRANRAPGTGTNTEFFVSTCNEGGLNVCDQDATDVSIFNNTILMIGNTDANTGFGSIHDNNNSCKAGVPKATNVTVANNVTLDLDNLNPKGWGLNNDSACTQYGTGGNQVHHNFEYSPNHTPQGLVDAITACGSTDGWVLSGTAAGSTGDGWSVKPGFSGDAGNWGGVLTTDLVPSSSGSRVCNVGSATIDALRAQADFFGNVCTTHDIGAICCPP